VLKWPMVLVVRVLPACSGERVEELLGEDTSGRPVTAAAALLMRMVGEPS